MRNDDVIRIYRVFKLNAREIWSLQIHDYLGDQFRASGWPVMNNPPFITTKNGVATLTKYLWDFMKKPYPNAVPVTLDEIMKVLEAYPASYHHAATQEIGIGIGLNENIYQKWPVYRWNVMEGDGQFINSGLTRQDLLDRKRNRHGKPGGLPDAIWKGLKP